MSRLTVRRLSTALVIAALLCAALPAAAAPVRPHATAPAAFGSSLLDQFLTWLGTFLPGQAPAGKSPAEKTTSTITYPSDSTGVLTTSDADHGGMIDPNG